MDPSGAPISCKAIDSALRRRVRSRTGGPAITRIAFCPQGAAQLRTPSAIPNSPALTDNSEEGTAPDPRSPHADETPMLSARRMYRMNSDVGIVRKGRGNW